MKIALVVGGAWLAFGGGFLVRHIVGADVWEAERASARASACSIWFNDVALLCLASVNAGWFHDAWREAFLLVPDRRINYWHPEEKPRSYNRDSVVFVFGQECKGEAVVLPVPPHMPEIKALYEYVHAAA